MRNDRKIQSEALQNRTSGFLFQKAKQQKRLKSCKRVSALFLPCKTFTGQRLDIVRARKRVMSWLGS